jgi:hypothetical protein
MRKMASSSGEVSLCLWSMRDLERETVDEEIDGGSALVSEFVEIGKM